MITAVNTLREVLVTGSSAESAFNPQKEYPEVYEKSKFALSPSRLLGRDAKDARRLKRYFDNEIKQRKIELYIQQEIGWQYHSDKMEGFKQFHGDLPTQNVFS